MATPRYLLTEPFYDNLTLHESGDEISWSGVPSPSMIPLNDEAQAKLAEYHQELGGTYLPPLAEMPISMDGKIEERVFSPGDRKNRLVSAAPAFPVTPGKEPASDIAADVSNNPPPMANMPKKAAKNFDRVPR